MGLDTNPSALTGEPDWAGLEAWEKSYHSEGFIEIHTAQESRQEVPQSSLGVEKEVGEAREIKFSSDR